MRPYGMRWDGYWVDMDPRSEMYGPRPPGFFENDKLSVRHISGDFEARLGGDEIVPLLSGFSREAVNGGG